MAHDTSLALPDSRKVFSEDLRASAVEAGIPMIRVVDDEGQWIEIRKGVEECGLHN